MDYDPILIPTDGSDVAERAILHAVDLAAGRGATLHVLYVVDTDAVDLSLGTEQVQRIKEGRFGEMTELRQRAEEAIERVVEAADRAGVETVEAVAAGSPAREILDYADEEGVQLTVMTRHTRSGLRKVLVGSVTDKVLKKADFPVLVVDS